jgi:hypothetical protein
VSVNSAVDDSLMPARLDALLRSRSSREAVAERSYWHPNGFLKIVLAGSSGAAQLRLHVWPETPDRHDVHDHAWPYRSIVLAGALSDVRYAQVAPGDLDAQVLWRHTYREEGPGRFRLDDPEAVNLRESTRRLLLPSMRSHGDAFCIHSFSAVVSPAVTLLAVGPRQQNHSSVYRRARFVEQSVVPAPTSPAEVATWVEFARAAQCST